MIHRCRRPTGRVNVMGDVWIERCTPDDPHDECKYHGPPRRVEGDGLVIRPTACPPSPSLPAATVRDMRVGQERTKNGTDEPRPGKDKR